MQAKKSHCKFHLLLADLECLLEKMSACQNNPEKSLKTKENKQIPTCYSLFTQCSFDSTKNMFDSYRGKYCMERFCKDFIKQATRKK